MAFGVRIYNADGYTQIDENYRNLQLINKTQLKIPKATTGNLASRWVDAGAATYKHLSPTSIIAIERLSDFKDDLRYQLSMQRIHYDNGTNSGSAAGSYQTIIMSTDYDKEITVNVYEFDVVTLAANSTYGMRVWHPTTGDLVFDSGYLPMKVANFARTSAPFAGTDKIAFTLTNPASNKRYAIAITENFFYYAQASTQRQFSYGGVRQVLEADGNYTFKYTYHTEVKLFMPNVSSKEYSDESKGLLIIDVSNY